MSKRKPAKPPKGTYLRGEIYWSKITHPNTGRSVRRSLECRTPEGAQQALDKLRVQLWLEPGEKNPVPRVPTNNWKSAALKWLDKQPRPVSDHLGVKQFNAEFGDRPLKECTVVVLIEALERLARKKKWKNTTYNRNATRVQAILNDARPLGETKKMIPKKTPAKDSARTEVLTEKQWLKLKEELPEYMRPIVMFAILTGLRLQNVTHLMWDHIDIKGRLAWVDAKHTKNGKRHTFPLSEEAVELLVMLRDRRAKRAADTGRGLCPWAFPYFSTEKATPDAIRMRKTREEHRIKMGLKQRLDKPVKNINHSWHLALERAGLGHYEYWTTPDGKKHQKWHGVGIVFHSMRHTFASWKRAAGVELKDIQDLGGWLDGRSVARYAHANMEHLRKAANLTAPWSGSEKDVSTSEAA